MTLRLTVRRQAWLDHVHRVAGEIDGLLPVVKGNGYGFGRDVLHPIASSLASSGIVCVGTIQELDDVAPGVRSLVLTPTLVAPSSTDAILTVGSAAHVDALHDWSGTVVLKVRSSMRRFGAPATQIAALRERATAAGLTVAGASMHLPLAGDDAGRRAEIELALDALPPELGLSVSHLSPTAFAALQAAHPDRTLQLRVGTALWHGDKSTMHLGADVLDVHAVAAGELVGYHHVAASGDGHVVVIGAGSAHGVAALANGDSPFHFARRRVPLLEAPHMHSSLAFVADGEPLPTVGEIVDVQRPLITSFADELSWT